MKTVSYLKNMSVYSLRSADLHFPSDTERTGLHGLMPEAAESLDPLVSHITSALDSCPLAHCVGCDEVKKPQRGLLVIFNSCD